MTTSRQLQAQTGITYRQLDYWCRCDYLRSEAEGLGSGHSRSFDEAELEVALVLGVLSAGDLLRPGGRFGDRDWLRPLLERVREHGLVGKFDVYSGFITLDLDALAASLPQVRVPARVRG